MSGECVFSRLVLASTAILPTPLVVQLGTTIAVIAEVAPGHPPGTA